MKKQANGILKSRSPSKTSEDKPFLNVLEPLRKSLKEPMVRFLPFLAQKGEVLRACMNVGSEEARLKQGRTDLFGRFFSKSSIPKGVCGQKA